MDNDTYVGTSQFLTPIGSFLDVRENLEFDWLFEGRKIVEPMKKPSKHRRE